MTHQERWQSDRRAEETGQRERSYGEPEWRGPGTWSQRFEPRYEPEEQGLRGGRRDEPWEGSSAGGPGAGRYGAQEEQGRGSHGSRYSPEERRRWAQGSDEARERGYGGYGGGYESERSARGAQRGYGQGEGSAGRMESSPRYGDSYGGPGSSYGDDAWRGPQHRYGDRGYRGPDQPWQRAFEGEGRSGVSRQSSGGSPYGSSWGGEGRYEGGSQGMGRPSSGGSSYGSSWSGEGRSGMERSGSPQTGENHRGKGPKNYRRSDDRIHEEVCERLKQHADLDASEIEVQVKGGVVVLSGEVAERSAKRMAEDAIDEISGVTDVNNQLRVRQGQGQRGSSSPSSSSSGSGSGSSSSGSGTEDKSLTPASRGNDSTTDGSREKARPTASR